MQQPATNPQGNYVDHPSAYTATRLRARCHEVIALLRAAGATDAHGLAGRLLAATDPETGEGMNDEAIVDNVVTFVGAGHETTAVALAWTLYALAHQQGLADRLADESECVLGDAPATADAVASLELHRRTVQEAMRLYPPVAAIVRTVVRAVRVGPFELKPGDHVTVATMPMQRNPAFWPDPQAFDESRFAPEATAARDRFTYLPFGDGPRVCIGAKFALNEAVLVLARLTPALRFAPSEGKPPKPMLRVTLRPSEGMRLKVNRNKSLDRRN
ncbi:cytochrome P450 [bacterium]|nr:cytochrome P450 [bacterium]